MADFDSFVEAVRNARYCVALTGAGASTESGLPDFRSKQGLWQGIDPTKLVSLSALRRNPVEFYQFYRIRLSRLRDAAPNRVHSVLARLEHMGILKALITQNIDGLHQQAGSRRVIEAHGSLRVSVCLQCRNQFPAEVLDVDVTSAEDVPRCDYCGGVVKPGVTLFEEALPAEAIDQAMEESKRADLMLVVGSSLEVAPVNILPRLAIGEGARLAIVNLDATHYDRMGDWVFHRMAGDVLTELLGRLETKERSTAP